MLMPNMAITLADKHLPHGLMEIHLNVDPDVLPAVAGARALCAF